MKLTRSFSPHLDAVADARAFVRHAVAALDPPVQLDVALMASELCTNAIQHGCGSIVVAIDCDEDRVTVSVSDQGSGRAQLQHVDLLVPRGRGLRIVDELSDGWGWSRSADDGGTSVWFQRVFTGQRPKLRS